MALGTHKTVTRSFRISEDALVAMQEEAGKRNVSVNTLLNQLLLSYANYDRFVKRFQMIKLTLVSFRRIMEAASEKSISKAGQLTGGNAPVAMIRARVGHITLESVVDFIRDTGDYTDFYEYSEVPDDGKRIITLSHQLGRKGSLYLEKYVGSLFASANVHPKVSVTADSVVFEV